jgi:hypothetical protein
VCVCVVCSESGRERQRDTGSGRETEIQRFRDSERDSEIQRERERKRE